ncbi:MAG TPA: 4-hydroxy-tetrahydrodipicolinate synthase [Mycobacteriales bacterium]
MSALPPAPFGRVLTAMVTPFTDDGALDLDAAVRVATHLADHGHDGLVLLGTTGEAATTSEAEQADVLRAVLDAVGGRLQVVYGVGSNDTAHARELARIGAKAGVQGLLATTPYYTRPTQDGVIAHVEAIAAETDLPLMLYDVPTRTGLALESDTIVRLADHPRVVAIKDAKGRLVETAEVRRRAPDLAVYSGSDEYTLPLLSLGAVGVVSVLAHVAGDEIAAMIRAFDAGDVATARDLHLQLSPAALAIFAFASPAPIKAALADRGLCSATVRLPLLPGTEAQRARLRDALALAGLAA